MCIDVCSIKQVPSRGRGPQHATYVVYVKYANVFHVPKPQTTKVEYGEHVEFANYVKSVLTHVIDVILFLSLCFLYKHQIHKIKHVFISDIFHIVTTRFA